MRCSSGLWQNAWPEPVKSTDSCFVGGCRFRSSSGALEHAIPNGPSREPGQYQPQVGFVGEPQVARSCVL